MVGYFLGVDIKKGGQNRLGKILMNTRRYLKYHEPNITEPIPFTKFKIVVSTEEDKQELLAASEHIHDSSIDTDFVTVNQIAHEYCNIGEYKQHSNIIVSQKLYDELNKL